MRLVILESPYAGEVELNVAYARACVRDSVLRGESPIASHLLFTQPGILNDLDPAERELGIAAGLAWLDRADGTIFYLDRGWSPGMIQAFDRVRREDRWFECRRLDGQPITPLR